jgi:hypothetical protein
MSALRRAIADLAETFANQVLAALRTASIVDIAALSGGQAPRGPGRPRKNAAAPAAEAPARGRRGRKRRTSADLEALGGRIADLVRNTPSGMRAEAIRDALGVPRKELPRVITQLLSNGQLSKKGQRRATTYFAGDGSPGKRSAGKRTGKRSSKRGSKKSG